MPIMLLICCYNHESPPDIHYLKRHKYDKCYQCSPSDKISQKWCFMINLWIESRENCNKTATVTRHFSKMYLYKIFNETLGRNYISGYKSYQCSDCDKAFSSPALMKKLLTHLTIHSGEKSYQCSNCEKSFANNSVLLKHVKIHTGEKPYRCIICDKAFSNNTGL